jgi:hypothetical protein
MHTPAHPTVLRDRDAQRQAQGYYSGWRLEPLVPNKANRLPPSDSGSESPPWVTPHLPWRRPLPHSPSWERLAPPGAQQQAKSRNRGRTEGAPISLPGRLPGWALASLGLQGLGFGRGSTTSLSKRAPPSRFQARGRGGDREGAGAVLQSLGLNRALGANHSVGGGGGVAGGWAGRGGDRLPHSQLPPSPTPPPRIRGAFHLLPRELRLRGSRVWSRGRDMAQQWDPTGTPLRLGVEGGESVRAVGQLAKSGHCRPGQGRAH